MFNLYGIHPLYQYNLKLTYVHIYIHTLPPREPVVKHLPSHHWLNPRFKTTLHQKHKVQRSKRYSNPDQNLVEDRHMTKKVCL